MASYINRRSVSFPSARARFRTQPDTSARSASVALSLFAGACLVASVAGSLTGPGTWTDPLDPLVRAEQFGDRWPFVASSGAVRCELLTNGDALVTFETPTRTYALNGSAREYGFREPAEALAPGYALNAVQPFIDLGLRLCDAGRVRH